MDEAMNIQRVYDAPAVETISLYWHFVDGIWVVIFAVVCLW
jgi:heme/copper-type cytochrome/quinol oxidase subunit 3